MFVGGTCGSVHVESFNKNMKALGFLRVSGIQFVKNLCGGCWRSRIRCYGPTSHRKGGREVKEGKVLMAKVGSMSSGTCTCEARMESVRNQDV